ncbi:MAG TPA: DMT family transporter [Myxococcaceae bacterium]|nr:DMT family transporter [Myxococcaceae bacterium]
MSRDTRTILFTVLALVGFASNSLLCRRALGLALVDPASFTSVRLLSGAAALALIVALRGTFRPAGGSWLSALALFVYAAAFSASYVRIGASVGALVLFATVQATMLAWGLVRGERPRPIQWLGIGLALGGLALLSLPGAHSSDSWGVLLMVAAGIAWGVYSLRGRGAQDPLATTAANFIRTLPMIAALSLLSVSSIHLSTAGTGLAVTSGALASGVGYSFWYAALPSLTATRAAAVQLSVPVLAAVGAILLLGETLAPRLVIAGMAILVGVWLAIQRR